MAQPLRDESQVSWAPRMPEAHLDDTDTILLLLAAETSDPGQRFRCDGFTRLEKLLFLLEKETDGDGAVCFGLFHVLFRESPGKTGFLRAPGGTIP